MEVLVIVLQVVGVVFVVDFLSGLLHWMEDAYGSEDFPITGKLVTKPNILHHHDPRAFTRNSWFYSARLLIVISGVPLLIAYLAGVGNWMWILAAVLGANANEFHKWAHRSPQENGPVITFFQRIGILQSVAHHAEHHKGYKNSHYCVLTNFLNPVLDGIGLWTGLEKALEAVFGLKRRPDHSVRSSLREAGPVIT